MDKNSEINDYISKEYCNIDLLRNNRQRIVLNKKYFTNYNSYNNILTNYYMTLNNPLLKENNFFLKSNNNKSTSKIDKTKKIVKLKADYNHLILNKNQNFADISFLNKKNNKSFNNQSKINKKLNNYSNIYINNEKYKQQKNLKNLNQLFYPNLNAYNSFNNNGFTSINSYHINNTDNYKNEQNLFRLEKTNEINNHCPTNKTMINKFNSSPYVNLKLNDNNNNYLNVQKYYNDTNNNNYEYKRNNIINFNENVNYNNIKNINYRTESSNTRKVINYNQEKSSTSLNNTKNNKSNKTKVGIKIYTNYQKIKDKIITTDKNKKNIIKINSNPNKICLKCQKEKINQTQSYNKKEPIINNYAFYEIKNNHSRKCFNNYNSNKINNLRNKTTENSYFNTSINKEKEKEENEKEKEKEKLNDSKILSLVRKNYELFLKKNKGLNLKQISNNIKKRKRHKSINQINKEKYLDTQKALSYRERESIHFKKPNSTKKSKNDVVKKIAKTLSQKKYKEDDKNIINQDIKNNVKAILFEKQKDELNNNQNVCNANINKYDIKYLKKQIGCRFSIFKKDDNVINECLNEVITYFNSENLKQNKVFN